MKFNSNYLLNVLFIPSLIVLLFNDFYWKEAYHNVITGKLSDVSGLIVLALFLTALRSDLKKQLFILVAVLFAFWKSSLSQPLIDSWNSLNILQFDRIIDYSDILCTLILIPLYWYSPNSLVKNPRTIKFISYPLQLVTLFAIVATSKATMIRTDKVYIHEYVTVKTTKDSFLNQLKKDTIAYTVSDDPLIVKYDTLERLILIDIILNHDTIYTASIGILDKGTKLKVYVESLQVNKEWGNEMDFKEYKRWSKKYRVESTEFFKDMKE